MRTLREALGSRVAHIAAAFEMYPLAVPPPANSLWRYMALLLAEYRGSVKRVFDSLLTILRDRRAWRNFKLLQDTT